jgi:hypothetical protein
MNKWLLNKNKAKKLDAFQIYLKNLRLKPINSLQYRYFGLNDVSFEEMREKRIEHQKAVEEYRKSNYWLGPI